MNKLLRLPAVLILAVVVTPVPAQEASRLYTVPALPPQEALDRLRLQTAWTARVPTDGRRDGLYSVQLARAGHRDGHPVQTRSGGVTALDGTTGRTRWTTRVGTPYRVAQPLALQPRVGLRCQQHRAVRAGPDHGTAAMAVRPGQRFGGSSRGRRRSDLPEPEQRRFTAYTLPNMAAWEKLARDGKRPGAGTMLEAGRARKGIDMPAIGPLSGAREAYRVPQTGPQPVERFSFAAGRQDRVGAGAVAGSNPAARRRRTGCRPGQGHKRSGLESHSCPRPPGGPRRAARRDGLHRR